MSNQQKEKNQLWYIKQRRCFSNDIKLFYQLLFNICRKKGLKIKKLGKISKENFILIQSKNIRKNNKNILIIGGIHGDEPAGCWGILDYLENVSKGILENINLSIVPIFNPSGFKLGNLRNVYGENPNRGYGLKLEEEKISKEGILFFNKSDPVKIAKAGLLTLHEDYDQTKFYIYSFEQSEKPGKFSKIMVNSCKALFKKYSGIADGFLSKKGIIYYSEKYSLLKDYLGSIETFSFKNGVKKVVCTETPRIKNIDKRIKANVKIIEKFVKYSLKNN